MVPLSASALRDAFRRLSEELARRKVNAHVYIVRGAAMAAGFDSQRLTPEVEVLIRERHA